MNLDLQETIIQALGSSALFLFSWVVLSKLLFKPYFELLEERESKTTGTEHGALKKREEALALRAKLADAQRELKVAGIAVREEVVQDAKLASQALVAEAEKAAELQINQAKESVRFYRSRAQDELSTEVDRVTELLMKQVMSFDGSDPSQSGTMQSKTIH